MQNHLYGITICFAHAVLPGIISSILISWPDSGNMMDWKKVDSCKFLAFCSNFLFSTHSALQVDIIVDIKPSQLGARLVRDVALILKCRKSVNWVIKSHDVQGKLEVIVS